MNKLIIILLFICSSLPGQKFDITFEGDTVYTVYWVLTWQEKIEYDRIINNNHGRTPIRKLTGQKYYVIEHYYDTLSRTFNNYQEAELFLKETGFEKIFGQYNSFFKESVYDVWADFIDVKSMRDTDFLQFVLE